MDKINAMQTFIKVADEGSFSKAALLISSTKTRVSQRISELEKDLGVRLLERNTRSLKLTSAGENYLSSCRDIISALDQAEQEIRGDLYGARGNIRVDMLSPIARWVIAPHLHEFTSMHPDVHLSIISNDRFTNLYENSADCAIRGGELKDSNMISRHLCNVSISLYASPDYASTLGENPYNLKGNQLITWLNLEDRKLLWNLYQGDEEVNIRTADHLYISDHDTALIHCSSGKGICPGMDIAVQDLVRSGKLVPVFKNWKFKPKPVSIIYPSRKNLPERVIIFINWIRQITKKMKLDLNISEDIYKLK